MPGTPTIPPAAMGLGTILGAMGRCAIGPPGAMVGAGLAATVLRGAKLKTTPGFMDPGATFGITIGATGRSATAEVIPGSALGPMEEEALLPTDAMS